MVKHAILDAQTTRTKLLFHAEIFANKWFYRLVACLGLFPARTLSLSLSLLFSHPLGWPGVPLVFSKKDALRLTTHTRTKDVSPTPTSSNLRPARLASKVSSGPVLAAQQQANLAGMDEAGTHQNRRRSQDLRRFLFCRRFLFFQSWMSH